MKIPQSLAWSASRWPNPAVREWVEALPVRVRDVEERWSIRVGEAFEPGGYTSYVAPATGPDGEACVLKLAYAWEPIRHEVDALRAWDGNRAIRLLRGEPFTMLLERCDPGASLWEHADADGVCVSILSSLWIPAPPDVPWARLSDIALEIGERISADFQRLGEPFDPAFASLATEFAAESATRQQPQILLHGDFHYGNVLSAGRASWLAIDPSPLVGEPAFDAARLITERPDEILEAGDPSKALGEKIGQLAAALELDAERLTGWSLTRCMSIVLNAMFDDAPWAHRQVELIPVLAAALA